ncbi:MAG TPA: ethylbenzene dehydrogenase-related protein [SAR324 cluster bacterium]|jgi:DMSO reductase family type II enzyme heme b subunit|nr:ethylbenzene dehydrogenase-related protein [SAR324 cluster bacterium]MDP6465549.1 ethylbenzene dehydrogenase-related protein [SAR324 cluster bacterium]MDP7334377.1 ethylbenzene dehydrogenase-related protein [SAR324 cluster bacterium]MEE1577486.1 ethylbenzene dehydrogenase-related protein [Deltaproteobacteria bacterium]HJM05248.1 ethylbenzene dehydrogenase-related protein [SAR324 cluster bacterium]|tara:strand:- start:3891 stop:5549 length:1659 start_codon:yes stop_codon:yes gene_type:complete
MKLQCDSKESVSKPSMLGAFPYLQFWPWKEWRILVLMILFQVFGTVWAQSPTKLLQTDETLAEGKRIYLDRCWYCHGKQGDGNGPAADFLDPRPRDFTAGMYKIRTTLTGELPTDEDLFGVVSRGIPGTAMPRWELTLSEPERWKVIHYIKKFADEFSDPEYDPYKAMVEIPPKVESSPNSITRGREVFEQNKCFECHGIEGKGDGREGLEDGWGYPVRVRNLTRGTNIKGGAKPENIVYRFTTGINGTPMPSFAKNISGEDRWHLANYIASIAATEFSEGVVLKALKVENPLPLDPEAEVWKNLPFLRIPLAGQVIAKPRWQNHAIDMVEVRALFNENEISFLVEWDDPFQDKEHDESQEIKEFEDTYVMAVDEIPRERGVFRDSIALQFPVKLKSGAKKPHFFRGDTSNPVNLWVWKSELQASGMSPVEDTNAKGFNKSLKIQPEAGQQVKGKGVWKNGRWRVVMNRPLHTEDRNDIQFEKGKMIPIAFNAWDGSNGEHGLIMSLSAWSFVYLDVPLRNSLYGYAVLVVLILGGFELFFIRYSRSKRSET